MAAGEFGIKTYITATGVIAPEIDIINDSKIRLMTTAAQSGNQVTFYGRISGQSGWTIIGTINGTDTQDFNVSMFDFVRLECTAFSAIGSRVELIGSGFIINGLSSVITPSGVLEAPTDLEFISSDSSVDISVSSGKIDLKAIGGGGGSVKYNKSVILGDWTLSGSEYVLSIPYSTHTIANPLIACYETNGASFDLLLAPSNIDASHNIIIKVPSTPDSRFVGKVIIE